MCDWVLDGRKSWVLEVSPLSQFISNSGVMRRQEEKQGEVGLPCPHRELVYQKVTCGNEFLYYS